MSVMKNPKYLKPVHNTWFVEKYIPQDVRHHFIHDESSPVRLRGTQRRKFYKTTGTGDLALAEIRKKPILAKWELQIKIARQRDGGEIVDPEEEQKQLRVLFNSMGGNEAAATTVGELIFPKPELLEDPDRVDIYGQVTGRMTPTAKYVEEWVEQHQYVGSVGRASARFLKEKFCKRFPYFESIERGQLKIWIDDQLQGRNEFATKLNRRTVSKHVGWVDKLWSYCEDKYTNAPNLSVPKSIMPVPRMTKAAQSASTNATYTPFAPLECHNLLNAAIDGDDLTLADTIRVGMYTGMRLGEICKMTLDRVGSDRFIVSDAKTDSGNREIPIHKEIQQVVERLKQTSNDGYLISGLSSNNADGNRAKGMSHKFSRLKSGLGFTKKRHAFHSFRASLANRFENAGVPENFAARIIGHAVVTMTYGIYSGQIDWSKAVEAMSKVSYEKVL